MDGAAQHKSLNRETTSRLKDAFKGKFLIGAVLGYDALQGKDPLSVDIATTHFDALTAENSMKPALVQPKEGEFDFADGDRLLQTAQ